MRGTFTAHGTWETSSRLPVLPVFGLLLAAALLSWLATILWLIAALLGAFLVLACGGLVVIHRYNRRETGRFVERMGALPAVSAPAVSAPPVTVIYQGGTHLHIEPGTGAEALIRQALPQQRDAITITTERKQRDGL